MTPPPREQGRLLLLATEVRGQFMIVTGKEIFTGLPKDLIYEVITV
jgi:hypothetical protein